MKEVQKGNPEERLLNLLISCINWMGIRSQLPVAESVQGPEMSSILASVLEPVNMKVSDGVKLVPLKMHLYILQEFVRD